MQKLALRITGMSCGHCVSRVTQALQALEGVALRSVEVGLAQLDFDPAKVAPQRIAQTIDDLGFEARTASQ